MTSIPSETTSGENTDQWERQRLREILSADDSPAREQIQQVLQLGAKRFGVELGLLVHVDAGERTYTIDEASAPHPNITRGRPADLLFTYCQRVVAEQKPLAITKAPEQGWAMDPADPSSQLSTYVGTAVHGRNDTFGAVCFVDLAPRESAFDEKDRSFLVDLGQAIERLLERRERPEPPPSGRLSQELPVEKQRYHTALNHSPVLFAKVDEELRYEWRLNPQSDLDPRDVAGKRDDELDSGPGIDQLMDFKRRALNQGEQMREEIVFEEPDGLTVYDVTATPLREGEGADVTGLITAALNVTERKEAKRRRKQVIHRVTDAIVEVDADWRFTLVNDQAEALYDMKEEDLLGKDFWDVFSTALGTRFEETYRHVMQSREPASLVEYYSDLDGWFDVQVYPNDDGGVAFYFQEVTEQKQQETRLRDLSNSIPGVVFQFCVQPDGTYSNNFVSKHAEDVLGLSPDPDTFFERCLERIPDSHRDAFQASVDAAVAEKAPWEFEFPFITPSGARRWILGRSTPRENDGELIYNGVLLDITDRKEGERRLDAVFNHTYQFTGLMEPDGTLIEANDTALEFGGVTEADVLGKPLWDTYWFQTETVDQERLQNAVRQAAEGTFVRYELEVQGRDETRIIDFSLRPVENEQGEITLLVPEGRDITDRKEAEEALKQSQERLSMALEGGNIGTWDWDVETGELIFNRQWAEMLGYSRDELDFHFSTWEELVHPEDLSRAMEMLDEYIEGERDTYAPKIRMQTKSGDWKWIQTIGKVVDRDEHGEVTRAAGIHLDIHDRKKAEIALRRSERRFRKIFENAAIGIVIGDEEGHLQRANPAFQKMLGYEEDELCGRHFSYITHPDDDAGQALLKELDEGKRDRFQVEKRYVRKDGESFWGRLTISLLQLDDETKHIALVEDIDEQKRYEAALREAKNEAEEAAQLKSVMLANMSHEVRTPLTSMIGFSSILERQLKDGRPAKIARLIHKSGQRLEDTIDAVLQLSQLEAGSYTLDRESLCLDALAERFADRFAPQAEERGVTVTVSTEPVEAYVDETALWHVFSNLLDNALKFTPEDGQVTVRVRTDGPKTAILEMEDTGVGISEDALPTVFEAFKQESEGLTREYEGAGLGLAIVRRLVETLGGQISVDTAKGEGTCVTVHLPRTSGDDSSSDAQ